MRDAFNIKVASCLLAIVLLGGCDAGQGRATGERGREALEQEVDRLGERLTIVERKLARLERQGRDVARVPETADLRTGERAVTAAESERPKAAGKVGQSVLFSSYPEGWVFSDFGTANMIVKTSAGLALTSASGTPATLEFSDFDISEQIEVLVEIRTGYWTDQEVVLLDGDVEIVAITVHNYDLRFGDHVKKRSRTGWKRGEGKNELRLTIADNRARLFVNGRFFGVQQVSFSRANKLRITGIKRDKDFVYAVTVRQLS